MVKVLDMVKVLKESPMIASFEEIVKEIQMLKKFLARGLSLSRE